MRTVPNCHIPSRIATFSRGQPKSFLCQTTILTHFTSVVSGLGCRGGVSIAARRLVQEENREASQLADARLVHLRAAIFHPWLCGWQCAGLEPQAPASLAPVPERRAPAPAVIGDCVGRTETSTSRFPFRDSIPSATTGKGLFGEPATAKRERSHGLGKPLTQRGSDVRPLYCLPRRLYWRLRDIPGHDAWSRTPLSTELR